MASYFSAFPLTTYSNIICTNTTLRAKLKDAVKLSKSLYYPYSVTEGERPDSVAYNYYGSCDFDWLIFFSNDIVDPYYDWPLSSDVLNAKVTKEYGSIYNAMSTIVYYISNDYNVYISYDGTTYLNETQYNELSPANKSGYNMVVQNDNLQITPDTYNMPYNITKLDITKWSAVDAYTNAINENEAKRNILLIDASYKDTIYGNLVTLLNS